MPAPINYGIQVADPFASAIQGLRLGATIQEMQAAQQKSAAQQKLLQQQAETQGNFNRKAQQMLQSGLNNATAEDFAELAFFTDKDMAEKYNKMFGQLEKSKQDAHLKQHAEILSMLRFGGETGPQMTADALKKRAELLRESGRPEDQREATILEAHAETAIKNPDFLQMDLANKMALLPGGKDYLENIDKVLKTRREEALAPAALQEANAKAQRAAVEADFAASKAVSDLALTDAQIKNYAADQEIARGNLAINKLRADLEREGNALKKQELKQKIDQAEVDRDEKLQKKVADANTAYANFDNFLNTADRALSNWGKTKDGKIDLKSPNFVVKQATGPLQSRLPTMGQDTADFEETIETLKSQAFLSQVEKMKGLGALTEREGAALTAALTNLSLRQSPEQLGRNLQEAQRLILKARNETERKFGVRAAPDRPEGPGGAAPAAVPSAMGQATQQAVTPGAPRAMPQGFRVLGREE